MSRAALHGLVACVLSATTVFAADLRPTGDATILPANANLELLWNDGEFTEGVAVAKDGQVYFSDIAIMAKNPGRIMKFDPRTKRTSVYVADSGQSNGLFFTADGRLLAVCGANVGLRALCEVTPDRAMHVLVDKFSGKRFNSPNDIAVHPRGWVYFSDPRYVGDEPLELKQQAVYRVDPDGSLHQATTNQLSRPNGVIVSPGGEFLYVAESGGSDSRRPRYALFAFPVNDNGTLGPQKLLIDFGDEMGIDGMTVDVKGHIYAAVRKPSRHGIIIYTHLGVEIAYIPTEPLPTNCTFGVGDEAQTLYVTAGAGLYRIPLNIPGYHPELLEK
ncbi:MAG: SMP-30/gluconolactonase/LRE family protein [Planctomycetaceae bacterium]